jgi:hypothetical protein
MFNSDMTPRNHSRRKSRFLQMKATVRAFACALVAVLLAGLLRGQTTSVQITTATPLAVELPRHVPMKVGEPLECHLLYPVYVENRIAIPAGAAVRGNVVRLDSDRSRRIHARLRGDFTPFRIPVVQFDQLVGPDGTLQPIASDIVKDGIPVLHLSPPPGQQKASFIRRQIFAGKQRLKETVATFTAPGRGDRLVQFIYTQLPYHPQRIESGTTWTVELAQPLNLQRSADGPVIDPAIAGNGRLAGQKPEVEERAAEQSNEWQLHAYLQRTISSAKEKQGDTFHALVAEPVFNADHTLAVPEGSLLVGEITKTKPARSFGRQGKLRFKFSELKLPDGFSQPVEGSLAGIDSNKAADLQIDSEGGIQPRSQNRVIVPLVLTLLAGRAFDDDGSRVGHSAIASNGFGIVGRLVGILASSRNVAAGIGVYGAALSVYDRWLAHGHDVVFAKNTRIEVTTTPGRNPLNAQQAPGKSAPAR